MLEDSYIQSQANSHKEYLKGIDYFIYGYVGDLRFNEVEYSFYAVVAYDEDYEVEVVFQEDLSVRSFSCHCWENYKYIGACRHVVAVLKAIQRNWDDYFGTIHPVRLSETVSKLMTYFSNADDDEHESREIAQLKTATLVPTLSSHHSNNVFLTFMIGCEKLYVLKDTRKFIEAHVRGSELRFGKNFTYYPRSIKFDDSSQALLDMMVAQHYNDQYVAASSYISSAYFSERKFRLDHSGLKRFIEIMGDREFSANLGSHLPVQTRITSGRPPITLSVEAYEHGIKASLTPHVGHYYIVDPEATLVFYDGLIYRMDKRFSGYLKALQHSFGWKSEVVVPFGYAPQFLDTVVAGVEKIGVVNLDESLSTRFFRQPPESQVYLDRYNDGVQVTVKFKYGEHEFDPFDPRPQASPVVDDKVLIRSSSDEARVLHLLNRYGFEQVKGAAVLPDEEAAYDFLRAGLPELADFAKVFYYETLKPVVKTTSKISTSIRLNTGKGLLEMSLDYSGMQAKELIALLASYKLKRRYSRLQDGTFLSLESPDFVGAARLVEELGLTEADLESKKVDLPRYRAMYIDSLSRELEGLRMERSGALKKMVQDIREPEDMEYAVPESLQGTLRDYQVTGFRWLKTLASYGFGGILADDMGLGKTLQVITLLLDEKTDQAAPSLVVAPTSLVYNWEAEVRKFAPALKVVVLAGLPAERQQRMQEISSADIVITSYGLVKRDIKHYSSTQFKYCFVDEAQNIKNPATLNAKAVKQIRAQGYFALTGTPIENNLTELWSIFDFLMPGYLLSHSKFVTRYETPIVKRSDKHALQELARHIKPFVLRRMKRDVLKELPPKVESKVICEMLPEQAKLYQAYLLRAKREYQDEIAQHGFENSRIKILALLTRLRQLCCHPGMFLEDYKGGSGKLETMLELVRDALSAGHRLLVFSQFTTMLDQVATSLQSSKVDYHYLDGSTPSEERMRLVNAFNAGEKPLFLLSLKAGGTGLNLTGADMVVHLDPWWNPAVEDQATDRAYRIGQGNSVQVFKLIARNTIEERIYELQHAKKELIDAVIQPGENLLTKMSEGEIRRLFDV